MAHLTAIRQGDGLNKAIIFVHGFSGKRDETWESFPTLLGTEVADWGIYTVGYDTTFMPDVLGVWAADPDIPIIAGSLYTQLTISPLDRYESLSLIAHSMGGLAVQQMLVEHADIVDRLSHLIMFGTPSNGLTKASWVRIWKRQFRNMANGSPFITNLRAAWTMKFGKVPPFRLTVVAGTKDQFVPPPSSLLPFDSKYHRVVPGNHLEIVKPKGAKSESFRLVVKELSYLAISAEAEPVTLAEAAAPLRLAAEAPPNEIEQMVVDKGEAMSEDEVVEAALGLERSGKREASIALLERYKNLGTDVQGTLAGRLKRVWLETEDEKHARRALDLYQNALSQALLVEHHEQVYYHAINVAFFNFVFVEDTKQTKQMAEVAIRHCGRAESSVWNIATVAEANLYLGHRDLALRTYREAAAAEAEPWQLESTSLQAAQIASKMGDEELLEELEGIFTPSARDVRRIFVSYSHKDTKWMERLRTMMAPYLRQAEKELDLWVDTRIQAGQDWENAINAALQAAGVAVLLVSRDFLDSEFIFKNELPVLLRAAESGSLTLLWIYLSPCAYDATDLVKIQAAHDLKNPLAALAHVDQEQVLLDIAKRIKATALVGSLRSNR